jgi:ribonuclease HI
MGKVIRIYTDGGCRGNKRGCENIGGYGAILTFGSHKKEISGSVANTTNNRCEMTALIKALEAIKMPNQTIEIHSDSAYLINAISKGWLYSWQKRGWQTSEKKPVENQDLWEKILILLDGHKTSLVKIKGHVNVESAKTDIDKLYKAFVKTNGKDYDMESFLLSLKMNTRADKLANIAMDGYNEQQ